MTLMILLISSDFWLMSSIAAVSCSIWRLHSISLFSASPEVSLATEALSAVRLTRLETSVLPVSFFLMSSLVRSALSRARPRMVRPLAPSVLVYGSWGNSDAFGYSNEEAFELAQRVVTYALTDFPELRVYLGGAQATRDMDEETIASRRAYSEMLRKFAEETPRCTYFDPLSRKELWQKDIFVEDGVHYNQKGFDLYRDFFQEVLKDELEKF